MSKPVFFIVICISVFAVTFTAATSCDANEMYSTCANGLCRFEFCTQYGQPLMFCPKFDSSKCKGGCVCKDNYLRNSNGICIPKEKCPEAACKKKKNEVYSDCTNGGCSARNCSQLGTPVPCVKIDPKYCIKGCICAEGYLRDSTGVCVPKQNCPSCGGDPNAVASECGNDCMNTCAMYKKERLPCLPVCFTNSCECKKGFVFDDNIKKCVKPEKCTPVCQENEEYSTCANGQCRFMFCTQYGQPLMHCPKFDNKNCKGGCLCKNNYLRNSDGVCIPKEECPQAVCKNRNNEVYSDCTNGGCSARNCSQLGTPVPCVKIDPKYCIKGCICEEGYLRDSTGVCVPKAKCASCGGDPNAVASECGNDCMNTCAMYKKERLPCLPVCFTNSCECKKGFVFDDNIKKCVKPEKCTPVCQENEEYSTCANGQCRFKFCTQYGQPLMHCPKFDNKNCKGGCLCKNNYLRNSDGVCIPKEECPQAVCKNRNNEVYSDCTNGGCSARNCSQLGTPVPCVKIDPKYCIKGCICEEGYLRDSTGVCVLKAKCESCGGDPNAIGSECGNDCMNTCAMYKKERIPCPPVCFENSCECKKGFVFDDNLKKCVQPDQCTPTCKENETYNPCAKGLCRYQFCTQYGQPTMFCSTKLDSNNCKGGCVCQENYLRNSDGVCIPKKECPQARCRSENHEIYSDCVNSGCVAKNCSQRGYPVPCPKIDANSCIKGCVCEEGYLRDDTDTCIPEENCPLICGPNENVNECVNGFCERQNCSQLGNRIQCDVIDTATCIKGCICIEGYVRDDQGDCIPKTSCPSCGGDPNAVISKCGNDCKNTCAMYSNNTLPCFNFCFKNSCACKENYIYDGNVQKCVRPEQCTKTCNTNETYSDCANGLCRPEFCVQYGQPSTSCATFDRTECEGGCICKENYLRNNDGFCVKKEDCPEAKSGIYEG